jgi:site-specific recombinase XerD
MNKIIEFEEKLLLRNLSESTVRSYVSTIKLVSERLNIPISDITECDLRHYIVKDKKRKISSSTQMAIINSFKAFFKEMDGRSFDHTILPRPKMEQKQPDILSTEEIQRILNFTPNLKHRSIIALMYSCAIRVSEVINLKVKDIDVKNNKINIRSGKGKIDRVVMLDGSILALLREYWSIYRTKEYLFEGEKGGKYSVTSVQNIVKSKAKAAGINKNISSHSLRHSCLTQLIKNGVDLRRVQKIAGHKNINTTANYIKMVDSDIIDTESPIRSISL